MTDKPNVIMIEVSDLFLVASDINRSLGELPGHLKVVVAPLVARMGEWRLTTINEGKAHPTELLTTFSKFLELLVEESR